MQKLREATNSRDAAFRAETFSVTFNVSLGRARNQPTWAL